MNKAPAHVRHPSTHAGRLERWMGMESIERIQAAMKGWYYKPIHILDVPGSVRVGADGDFIGPFERGNYFSAMDAYFEFQARLMLASYPRMMAGFASISDALKSASSGYSQKPGGMFNKVGPTGVVGVTSSLHKIGPQPAAGVAAAAAPGARRRHPA